MPRNRETGKRRTPSGPKGLLRNAARQVTNTLPRKLKHPVTMNLNAPGTMQKPTPRSQADPATGETRRQP